MNSALAAGLQIGFVILVLAIAYVPLGDYMARVFTGPHSLRASGLSTIKHSRVERLIYRVGRVDPETEQTWVGYTLSLLGFSFASVIFLYVLQRIQGVMPLSGGLSAVSPAVAFNTAVSFVTNTNWQSYTPETTMSNLTQMVGLAVQNFVSAAVGLTVAVALIRGVVRTTAGGELGNFWVDLVRASLRILLPLSFVVALILLSQGTIQSLYTHFDATALDGTAQHIALAPVASQEAIKEIGTNGGGILGANSAHPFENPTPLSNVVEILAILIIPVCLTRTYSTMVGDKRQGLTVLSVMGTLFGGMLALVTWAESSPRGIAAQAAGAMMEGKEVRFGIPASALFAVSTTGTSTGAVDAAHDSFTAAGGGALILNMLLGEIAPGGWAPACTEFWCLPSSRCSWAAYWSAGHRNSSARRSVAARSPWPRCPCWSCRRSCLSVPGSRWRFRRRRDTKATVVIRVRRRPYMDSPRCCTRTPRPPTTTEAPSAASR
ncbi:Potassium-transporting ATPase A chain [Mycobacteroides abscessus]|nr:Potassium-transporting ATPase A chain [Mycobacteroides abscessus]